MTAIWKAIEPYSFVDAFGPWPDRQILTKAREIIYDGVKSFIAAQGGDLELVPVISTINGDSASSWTRLVRFVSDTDSRPLLGEPLDPDIDVGAAICANKSFEVVVYSGQSILDAGYKTARRAWVSRILSPLSVSEVRTIRGIALNFYSHAKSTGLVRLISFPIYIFLLTVAQIVPKEPMMFMKPECALADPFPAPTVIPRSTLLDDSCDYESELAVVIGKACKNVSEEAALDYVLCVTACNDISSRKKQWEQKQVHPNIIIVSNQTDRIYSGVLVKDLTHLVQLDHAWSSSPQCLR